MVAAEDLPEVHIAYQEAGDMAAVVEDKDQGSQRMALQVVLLEGGEGPLGM